MSTWSLHQQLQPVEPAFAGLCLMWACGPAGRQAALLVLVFLAGLSVAVSYAPHLSSALPALVICSIEQVPDVWRAFGGRRTGA